MTAVYVLIQHVLMSAERGYENKALNARIGAFTSWARTSDRAARTRPARDQFLQKFEDEVDPEGILPERERRERAVSARKAYMLQLAKRSAMARRIKAGMGIAEPEKAAGEQ